MDVSRLQDEVKQQRQSLEELEQKLSKLSGKPEKSWYRSGFYTSYYVIAGLILGALAAWVALAFNVLGAWISFGDPFRLLRVYATFFGGASILDGKQDGIAILLALILHSATGAVVGAPIHVIFSRFVVGLNLQKRILAGIGLGIVMWLVNFYGILSWLQPMVSGGQQIINEIPMWVAALTHICFTLTMLMLQPYWAFDPQRVQARSEYSQVVATDV
jgi:hypothetical protein